ncbi:MAG TPA: hypothetical protein VGJ15_03515 [Pirellulales bacterium]
MNQPSETIRPRQRRKASAADGPASPAQLRTRILARVPLVSIETAASAGQAVAANSTAAETASRQKMPKAGSVQTAAAKAAAVSVTAKVAKAGEVDTVVVQPPVRPRIEPAAVAPSTIATLPEAAPAEAAGIESLVQEAIRQLRIDSAHGVASGPHAAAVATVGSSRGTWLFALLRRRSLLAGILITGAVIAGAIVMNNRAHQNVDQLRTRRNSASQNAANGPAHAKKSEVDPKHSDQQTNNQPHRQPQTPPGGAAPLAGQASVAGAAPVTGQASTGAKSFAPVPDLLSPPRGNDTAGNRVDKTGPSMEATNPAPAANSPAAIGQEKAPGGNREANRAAVPIGTQSSAQPGINSRAPTFNADGIPPMADYHPPQPVVPYSTAGGGYSGGYPTTQTPNATIYSASRNASPWTYSVGAPAGGVPNTNVGSTPSGSTGGASNGAPVGVPYGTPNAAPFGASSGVPFGAAGGVGGGAAFSGSIDRVPLQNSR